MIWDSWGSKTRKAGWSLCYPTVHHHLCDKEQCHKAFFKEMEYTEFGICDDLHKEGSILSFLIWIWVWFLFWSPLEEILLLLTVFQYIQQLSSRQSITQDLIFQGKPLLVRSVLIQWSQKSLLVHFKAESKHWRCCLSNFAGKLVSSLNQKVSLIHTSMDTSGTRWEATFRRRFHWANPMCT